MTANGKRNLRETGIVFCYNIPYVLSDHLWLHSLSPSFYDENERKLLWECDANGFTQLEIKIDSNFVVKKFGFRMVYKKDIEDLN